MLAHRGVLILVFGILGLVLCAPLGIAAFVMGRADLGRMSAGVMDSSGRTITQIGMILGAIATVIFVIQLAWGILYAIGAASKPFFWVF